MTHVKYSPINSRKRLRLINHARAFMNALGQLSRSPFATLLTFAVIGIALALPLSLSVLLNNIQAVSNGVENNGQINLYLKTDLTNDQLQSTLNVLNLDSNISHSEYISPDQGLAQFSQSANIDISSLGLQHNPLPAVIIVTPAAKLSIDQIQRLVNRLNQLPSVTQAQLDMQWLQRLNAIIDLGNRLATLLMIMFAIAVILIIANTIRLTTQHHHNEILVIKLIGGTNRFIRRPFLYSGALYGFVGAIFAWFIVDIVMSALRSPVAKVASLYGSNYQLTNLDLGNTIVLLFSGAMLGLFAAWLTVSKYIRSIEPK